MRDRHTRKSLSLTRRCCVVLLAMAVSAPAVARDSIEDILRKGIRIILNGNDRSNQQDTAGQPVGAPRNDYYIDYRIKRRLNDADQLAVAQATQRALDSGQSERWRNRRAGVTVLISVSDVNRYDDFRYTRDDVDAYRRDERSYSTYPDGQYQRSEPSRSTRDNRRVPALVHIDDWYRVVERAPVRSGPGRDYDSVATLRDDDYVHVVGIVGQTGQRRRNRWVFVDDEGTGVGFVNAQRLATYRSGQVELSDIRDVANDDGSGNYDSRTTCRSLTQRLVTDRIDESYTSTWCLDANNAWEIVQ